MKTKLFLVIVFFFINKNTFSQNKQLFFEDGKTLSSEGKMINGKKEGEWINYYQDGKTIYSKTNYKKDIKEGMYTVFHTNGIVGLKLNFVNGLEEGLLEIYTEKAVIELSKTYVNGKQNGEELAYYRFGGKLMYKAIVNEKGLQGEYFYYRENGDIEKKLTYVDNVRNGPTILYNTNETKEVGNYLNGFQIGEWKKFDKNDNINEIVNYNSEGKKSGDYKIFIYNGHIRKGKYLDDKKNGTWIELDEFDNVFGIFYYNNGVLEKSRYPTEIFFKNTSSKTLSLLIKYKDLDDEWKTEGWFILKSGEKKMIRKSLGSSFYYYAVDTKNGVWKGSQRIEFKGKYYPFKELDFDKSRIEIEGNTYLMTLK